MELSLLTRVDSYQGLDPRLGGTVPPLYYQLNVSVILLKHSDITHAGSGDSYKGSALASALLMIT
jgi:hypothetical protein